MVSEEDESNTIQDKVLEQDVSQTLQYKFEVLEILQKGKATCTKKRLRYMKRNYKNSNRDLRT